MNLINNQNIDELELFKQNEIKNMKKLRLAAWMLLVLVDVGVIVFFLHAIYSVYIERNLDANFLAYVMPTIFFLQGILMLGLVPVGILIYFKYQYTFKEINSLNTEYLQRYRGYIRSIDRLFAGIPPYLFTQRGMIIFGNFKHLLFPPNSIDKLTITIILQGGMHRNVIKFYQNNQVKSTRSFMGFQTRRLEFLKTNVKHQNPNCIINEEVKDTRWFS